MVQTADIMREIVEGMQIPLSITQVENIGGRQRLHVKCSTQYLHVKSSVTLGMNTFRVLAFEPDEWIEVSASPVVSPGVYMLPVPYFIHGKLAKVNEELASINNPTTWNPLIWMFEIQERVRPTDFDSRFQSSGEIRLFFLNSANWEDFTTKDHYREIIKPLSSLVDIFEKRATKVLKVDFLETFRTINHVRLTTGGRDLAVNGTKPLPDEQSGIEVVVSFPIVKPKCKC